MSKIIPKPFNKSKRILRAIFQGSPNLFTTSDLNRQIEAFEDRIKNLEGRMYSGVLSDAEINIRPSVTSGEELVVTLSSLSLWGISLSSGTSMAIPLGVYARTFAGSIYLWYTTKVVTYADDATHEISGARFEDGTSEKAADHLVVSDWGIVVGSDLPEGAHAIELFKGVYPGFSGIKMFAPAGLNIMHKFYEQQKELSTVNQSTERIKTSLAVKRYRGYWESANAGPFQSYAGVMIIFTETFGYVHLRVDATNTIEDNEAYLTSTDLKDYTSQCNCTKEEAFQWLREALTFNRILGSDSYFVGASNYSTQGLNTAEFSFDLTADEIRFRFQFSNANDTSMDAEFKIPFIKE